MMKRKRLTMPRATQDYNLDLVAVEAEEDYTYHAR